MDSMVGDGGCVVTSIEYAYRDESNQQLLRNSTCYQTWTRREGYNVGKAESEIRICFENVHRESGKGDP